MWKWRSLYDFFFHQKMRHWYLGNYKKQTNKQKQNRKNKNKTKTKNKKNKKKQKQKKNKNKKQKKKKEREEGRKIFTRFNRRRENRNVGSMWTHPYTLKC